MESALCPFPFETNVSCKLVPYRDVSSLGGGKMCFVCARVCVLCVWRLMPPQKKEFFVCLQHETGFMLSEITQPSVAPVARPR